MTDLSIAPEGKPASPAPKTAAEAIVHAEAKAGIRDAKRMRLWGYGVAGFCASQVFATLLVEDLRLTRAAHTFMKLTIIPGHIYGLNPKETLYFFAMPVALAVGLVGHVLLNRRTAKAIADPATIGIFDPDVKW